MGRASRDDHPASPLANGGSVSLIAHGGTDDQKPVQRSST